MQNMIQSIFNHYQPKAIGEKRRYAVLLPLVKVKGDWHLLYQVRSEHISQPGEVAFPGGASDPNETLQETVTRETMEELNLRADQIQIYGEMDFFVHENRTIHSFVGELLVDDWETIVPNEEVARLFTIPLKELIEEDPTYYDLAMSVQPAQDFPFERIRGGSNYRFYQSLRSIPFYNASDENLWGMTAMFTHRFTEILSDYPELLKGL